MRSAIGRPHTPFLRAFGPDSCRAKIERISQSGPESGRDFGRLSYIPAMTVLYSSPDCLLLDLEKAEAAEEREVHAEVRLCVQLRVHLHTPINITLFFFCITLTPGVE
jgi:hypothetical protein